MNRAPPETIKVDAAIPSTAGRMSHEQAQRAADTMEEKLWYTGISTEQAVDLGLTAVSFVPVVGNAISIGVSAYEAGTKHKITGRELSDVEQAVAVASIGTSLLPGGRAATAIAMQATKATVKEGIHEMIRPATPERAELSSQVHSERLGTKAWTHEEVETNAHLPDDQRGAKLNEAIIAHNKTLPEEKRIPELTAAQQQEVNNAHLVGQGIYANDHSDLRAKHEEMPSLGQRQKRMAIEGGFCGGVERTVHVPLASHQVKALEVRSDRELTRAFSDADLQSTLAAGGASPNAIQSFFRSLHTPPMYVTDIIKRRERNGEVGTIIPYDPVQHMSGSEKDEITRAFQAILKPYRAQAR